MALSCVDKSNQRLQVFSRQPQVDQGTRMLVFHQKASEEITSKAENRLVCLDQCAIFTDQSDIREVSLMQEGLERLLSKNIEVTPCQPKLHLCHPWQIFHPPHRPQEKL